MPALTLELYCPNVMMTRVYKVASCWPASATASPLHLAPMWQQCHPNTSQGAKVAECTRRVKLS
eukprot:23278-Amphidinium_carterae.1